MLADSLNSSSVLIAMVSECEYLRQYSVLSQKWIVIQKLSDLLKIFYNATINQSINYYTTLNMTRRVIEILCDAVHDSSELEIDILSKIGEVTKDKLNNYTNLVASELSNFSTILDPQFAYTEARDENYLEFLLNKGKSAQEESN